MIPRAGAVRSLLMILALALVHPAEAGARGFFGFSFGLPLAGPPAYYPPPPVYYYYYPPVYYPPPVYYVPPPPAPAYVEPPARAPLSMQECREYHSTVTVGGVQQPVYGTACRQPDGSWRIVQ